VQETDFASGKSQNALDDVWVKEWATFMSSVIGGREKRNGNETLLSACGVDAWEALKIVEATYEASRNGTSVMLRRSAAGVYDASLSAN
jgi:hypothetical protein